jgi:hypothetical protein
MVALFVVTYKGSLVAPRIFFSDKGELLEIPLAVRGCPAGAGQPVIIT